MTLAYICESVATEEEEKQKEEEQKRPASKTTRAALRAALSLREMIELSECGAVGFILQVTELSTLHSSPLVHFPCSAFAVAHSSLHSAGGPAVCPRECSYSAQESQEGKKRSRRGKAERGMGESPIQSVSVPQAIR